jgi:hypothetical protein
MAGLFTLGKIVIRPQAARLMTMQSINPASLLLRHGTGTGATQVKTSGGPTTRPYVKAAESSPSTGRVAGSCL